MPRHLERPLPETQKEAFGLPPFERFGQAGAGVVGCRRFDTTPPRHPPPEAFAPGNGVSMRPIAATGPSGRMQADAVDSTVHVT